MRDRVLAAMTRLPPAFGLYKGAVGVSLLCLETEHSDHARMPLSEPE